MTREVAFADWLRMVSIIRPRRWGWVGPPTLDQSKMAGRLFFVENEGGLIRGHRGLRPASPNHRSALCSFPPRRGEADVHWAVHSTLQFSCRWAAEPSALVVSTVAYGAPAKAALELQGQRCFLFQNIEAAG